MIRGYAAAQTAYDAMEAPCDEPDPPMVGCSGDGRAVCPDCQGRGVIRGRHIARPCACSDEGRPGVVPCDGCDWCEPEMGKGSAA